MLIFACSGGHIGHMISIKNVNFVKEHPMILLVQFVFYQYCNYFIYFPIVSYVKHLLAVVAILDLRSIQKNTNFVKDHPMIIQLSSFWTIQLWILDNKLVLLDLMAILNIVHLRNYNFCLVSQKEHLFPSSQVVSKKKILMYDSDRTITDIKWWQ